MFPLAGLLLILIVIKIILIIGYVAMQMVTFCKKRSSQLLITQRSEVLEDRVVVGAPF